MGVDDDSPSAQRMEPILVDNLGFNFGFDDDEDDEGVAGSSSRSILLTQSLFYGQISFFFLVFSFIWYRFSLSID